MPVMQYLTTCIFDHGAVKQLAPTLSGFGGKRPLIVTDPGIKAAGLLDQVLAQLPDNIAIVFDQTESNPTEKQAREATTLYNAENCDSLIALGGGSSMDLAKGVGLMATHSGPYDQYAARLGGAGKIGKIPPLIAIPTTAGTGSEVSVGTVLIMDSGQKETLVSPNFIPATAICDPDLTLGLPAHLTAATGMDAVTHCIEAVLSPTINPPAEGIGYDGLYRAVGTDWLRRAVGDGTDPSARWHMMMASYQGALAFVKGLGSVHALSHAAGRNHELKLHHGTLNAIWLPHLLRFNVGVADEKYDRLRQVMGLKLNADIADYIDQLNADIGIPPYLKALGVTSDYGPGIVAYAMKDLSHMSNAKPVSEADYERLFELALG